MKNIKLARGMATVLGGAALSAASISSVSASTPMYNKYVSGAVAATAEACGGAGSAVGGACFGNTDDWVGNGTSPALGHSGTPVMHWGVE